MDGSPYDILVPSFLILPWLAIFKEYLPYDSDYR